MPLFRGRSMFFDNFGLMPARKPIFVVVGAPLDIPPNNMTEEQRTNLKPKFDKITKEPLNEDAKIVDELHKKYIAALQQLYSQMKDAKWNLSGQKREKSMKIK